MGWISLAFRSSEFSPQTPLGAMKPVFEKLEILEIPAQGSSAGAEPLALSARDVVERVISRAEDSAGIGRNRWGAARQSVRASVTATR